jgi:hypothetical protein
MIRKVLKPTPGNRLAMLKELKMLIKFERVGPPFQTARIELLNGKAIICK